MRDRATIALSDRGELELAVSTRPPNLNLWYGYELHSYRLALASLSSIRRNYADARPTPGLSDTKLDHAGNVCSGSVYNYNSSERNMLMNNIPHATDRAAWECACGVGRDATSDGLAGPASTPHDLPYCYSRPRSRPLPKTLTLDQHTRRPRRRPSSTPNYPACPSL